LLPASHYRAVIYASSEDPSIFKLTELLTVIHEGVTNTGKVLLQAELYVIVALFVIIVV